MATKQLVPDNLQKAADDLEKLVVTSKRKLLEFEVMLAEADIQAGKSKSYKKAADLIKNVTS